MDDPCCEEVCFCEFEQLSGDALAACQNGTEGEYYAGPTGWCYVDLDQGLGSEAALYWGCRRRLRVLPVRGSYDAVLVCEGSVVTVP